jgi:5'-deoxynucleotidase YfbR-like HD superfamily hydrolase
MKSDVNQKIRNAMKAGYDKTGTVYTPPKEVGNVRKLMNPLPKNKIEPMKKASQMIINLVKKPKVSKSAEKARLKEERISKLRKELSKENAITTANTDKKAQKSNKDTLRMIEQDRKNKDAANAKRTKEIKESIQKGIKIREEEGRQEYMKEMENKKRLRLYKEAQSTIY